MQSPRALLLAQDLLRALRAREGERDGWLVPLLRAVRASTGSEAVCLGEIASPGWTRSVLLSSGLQRRTEPRLGGFSKRLVESGGSVFEPVLHRGSLYRARVDGWEGVSCGGFAGVCIPGESKGWLSILRVHDGPVFDLQTLSLLHLGAEAAATALAHEGQRHELEALAMTDGLTRIPNYRFLRQAVEAEILRALRCDDYFTVVMVDVDNLKKYNAAHGHLAGSEVLQRLAMILRENVRRSDIAAKYGGDEFLLILPHTRPQGGVALSERLRRRIAEHLRGCAGEALSCSFGVAGFPENGCDYESLVTASDQALFRAKSEGRNAVVSVAGSGARNEGRPGDPGTAPIERRDAA
jgi:diguanylate cyclase (GGDEF)-like protein